ncbi:hypothetical protein ACFFHF_12390 [Robertmurraya beringensis]|jgi:hypothetical protein|uniref:Uncharacterized protein n=1 Tax=Robertmurraya beringensis TaxID=641660 RepID=A0ABV6KRS4_9BACI
MNQSLSTFLKIGITVICISAFLFFIGYNMIGTETNDYQTDITNMSNNLPTGAGVRANQ